MMNENALIESMQSETVFELTGTEAQQRGKEEQYVFVDVREMFEHQVEAVADAIVHSFSGFDAHRLNQEIDGRRPIFYCRTGVRSRKALNKMLTAGFDAQHIIGGIQGWKAAGLPVESSKTGTSIDVMRQTQLAAGSILMGLSVLAYFFSPLWMVGVTAVGLGLFHAGASGSCALAAAISWLPWNRTTSCQS
jgi:rhodanese-related sulfurtransferase